jgi:hypothetical protein
MFFPRYYNTDYNKKYVISYYIRTSIKELIPRLPILDNQDSSMIVFRLEKRMDE